MNCERLFQTHQVRRQMCLDGVWEFQTLEKPALPTDYGDSISVPSCWEMVMPYCRYRGLAAYRRKLTLRHRRNIRFLFKGVSHSGTVYLDGEKIAFHYNAYTPFTVVKPDAAAGEHVLEIVVDNRFTEESKLHIPNDYYTYGGITRPVFMEEIPDCYIKRMEFEPYVRDGRWNALVRIFMDNLAMEEIHVSLKLTCAGEEWEGEVSLPGGQESELQAAMAFENTEAWSCEKPQLYDLQAVLSVDGMAVDDLADRVGFRTVGRKNGKLLINGEPVFLKGVNRHEDHGTCGCAIPLQLMEADIKLIRELGANAVRTCHYPNDERFLDLCDQNGILVWEESHDRGGDEARITHPLFIEQSMAVMQEMLENHYNHPSIIIWGCLNEAASDCENGAAVYKQHLDYLAADRTRLNTFASNKCDTDLCLGMENICSFNMYPYWYGEASTDEILERIYGLVIRTGNEDKPIVVSEYGGGGIYNFHDVMRVKWSEEYQADLMRTVTSRLLGEARLAGIFVWQFCDTRVSQEGPRNWPMTRPQSRNNKGLVDEYRRPKQAFYAVKEIFGSIFKSPGQIKLPAGQDQE